MDIRDYARAVRASGVLLVLGLLLGGCVAGVVSALLPEQYTANSQLLVSSRVTGDPATAAQAGQFAAQRIASYEAVLTSRDLASAVIRDLSLDEEPEDLLARIDVSLQPETTVLDVSVTAPSAQRALAEVQSVDQNFQSFVQSLETPPGTNVSPVRVDVIGAPVLPDAPSSPRLAVNTAVGAAVGLLLAAVVAVLRYRLDTTVKDDATASSAAGGAPVVGHVPKDDGLARRQLLPPRSTTLTAEAFRHLRTNLNFLDVDDPPRSILVTSSVPGEGKTTVTVNLATVLAESGNAVTVVDGDLRRPRLDDHLGLPGGTGLTTVLIGAAPLPQVLQSLDGGAVQVLTGGPIPPNPSELLSSVAMAEVLRQLAADRDVVLIDAPPLLPVTDAAALAGLVDGVLLCARWGEVTGEQLRRSATTIERVGGRLMGVILTVIPGRPETASYGYGVEPPTPLDRVARLLHALRRREQVLPDLRLPLPAVRPRKAPPAGLHRERVGRSAAEHTDPQEHRRPGAPPPSTGAGGIPA
ncbi:polysaccharide biosynthesis tyrosine autokinase [Geodermatophilus sp. TF02-6]|uniref:polysaccharide biosynthesis tyrosine autokinase n=1 Tax=Geodermatophilus sp. TF02-6 TaxID=2250575 RepID=UPI0013141255|nr:polysaccharide biosynthesis tyrosine autokinase [Geodermatophilus sp. TF02-6]